MGSLIGLVGGIGLVLVLWTFVEPQRPSRRRIRNPRLLGLCVACGLATAYIERPLEFGARQPKDVSPQPGNDLHARDLLALADQLDC